METNVAISCENDNGQVFGRRLREFREGRRMTLAGLSRASGLKVRRCAELEWGFEPRVSEIQLVAGALDVHPRHLLGLTPSATAVLFGQRYDGAPGRTQVAVMALLRRIGRVVLRVVGGENVS